MLALQSSVDVARSMATGESPPRPDFLAPSLSLPAPDHWSSWDLQDFSPITPILPQDKPVSAALSSSSVDSAATDVASVSTSTSPSSVEEIKPTNKKRVFSHKTNQKYKSLSSSSSSSSLSGTASSTDEPLSAVITQPSANSNKLFLPRIVKQDIRRSYATMFSNVYNTCDFGFTMQFLETFCRPDALYSLRKIPLYESAVALEVQDVRKNVMLHHINAQVSNTQVCCIRGLEGIGKYWYHHMQESPDYVFKLEQIQFKLKSDQTGCVTFTYANEGVLLIPKAVEESRKKLCDVDYHHTDVFKQAFGELPAEQQPQYGVETEIERKKYVDNALNMSYQAKDTLVEVFDRDGNQFDFQGICPTPDAIIELHHKRSKADILKAHHNTDDSVVQAPSKKAKLADPATIETIQYRMEGSICMHFDADSRVYYLDYHIVEKMPAV